MGESYRGLTIRFGGDASGLRASLRSIDSAVATTQRQLRKIEKGLRLDPSDAGLAALQLEHMGERAGDLGAKLDGLRKTADLAARNGVRRLADESRNSSLELARANQAYVESTAALERMNAPLRKIADGMGLEHADDRMREVVDALRRAGRITEEQAESWDRLARAHARYQDELSRAKDVAAFKDLQSEMAATEAEARSLARRMADLESASGLGGAASARLKEAADGLGKADEAAEALRRELALVEDALRLDPGNEDLARKRLKVLEEQLEEAKRRAELLDGAIGDLRSSGIDAAKSSMRELNEEVDRARDAYARASSEARAAAAEADELARAQERMARAGDLGEPYERLGADLERARAKAASLNDEAGRMREAFDTARARRELRDLETQAHATAAQVASIDAAYRGQSESKGPGMWAWRSIGVSMSSTATPAIVGAAYAATSGAETIDAAFRDMKKTVDGTDEQFERLRQSAIDYSKTHVTSADTILQIEAMGGQLGIAAENLEEFAVVASNLDIATDLDAESISQAMGQLNNVMDWGEGDMERFGDALVRLGNNMPAQESAIVDITKRIGAAGTMYGMTTPEVLAWSTAIASTGQNCEAAGTAVSNSLSDIESAVASGGERLEGFAAVAGMLPEEFAALWNSDASAAFQAFVEGLARIESEGGSADVALDGLGITGVRQKQALKGLSQTVDVLNDSLEMSDDAWNGVGDRWGDAGDAAREASQKSEGFSGAMAMMRNSLAALSDEVGEGLLPFVRAATDGINALTGALDGMPAPVKSAVVAVAGIAAAAGPIINVGASVRNLAGSFGGASKKASSLKRSLKGSGDEADKASGKLGKLKDGADGSSKKFDGLRNVSGLLKGGLVTLATGGIAMVIDHFVDAAEREEKFKRATEGLTDAMDGGIIGTVGEYSDEVGGIADSADAARERTDALIESSIALADEIEERHGSLRTDNAMLWDYANTIASLAGQSDLSAEDVTRLKLAVDGVNDACGTSYEVVQDQGGAYQVMSDGAAVAADAVMDLAEAQIIQSAIDVYTQDYEETAKSAKEAAEEVAKTQRQLDEEIAARDEALASIYEYEERTGLNPIELGLDSEYMRLCGEFNKHLQKTHELEEDLAEQTGIYDERAAAVDKSVQAITYLTSALQDGTPYEKFIAHNTMLIEGLLQSGVSFDEFASALEQTGLSVDQLSGMSGETLSSLVSNFDGSAQSIIASLISMNDGTAEQLEGFANCFDENGVAVQASLYAFAETLRASGLDTAAQYVQTFADTLSGAAGQAAESAGEVQQAATDTLDAGAGEAGEAGAESAQEYTDAVGEGADPAAEAASGVVESAEKALSAGNSYDIGHNFATGYGDGITSGTEYVQEAVRKLVANAVTAANSAQDSNSPSRVAMGIGGFFSSGYALGVGGGAAEAAAASADMVRRAASAAEAAAGKADLPAMWASEVAWRNSPAAAPERARGLTKADVYDAVVAAIGSASLAAGEPAPVAVYVDGRQLARSLSRHMDEEFGSMESRRSR